MSGLAWMDQALCARLADWDRADPEDQAETCAHCPVAAQCLDYALTHNLRFGIWGGTSGHERKRLQRKAK